MTESTNNFVPDTNASDLYKVHRAVRGDDIFRARVEAASWSIGVPFNEELIAHVARAVASEIQVDQFGAVRTTNVNDKDILEAVVTTVYVE